MGFTDDEYSRKVTEDIKVSEESKWSLLEYFLLTFDFVLTCNINNYVLLNGIKPNVTLYEYA